MKGNSSIFDIYNTTRCHPTGETYSNYEDIVALQIILLHNTLIKKELRICVYSFSFPHQIIALSYGKCSLFHLKCAFRSRGIQIFVFPTSPQFFHVSHCLRRWFKINLKVYDVSNCLNKNLVAHFVWYLENEKNIWLSKMKMSSTRKLSAWTCPLKHKLPKHFLYFFSVL